MKKLINRKKLAQVFRCAAGDVLDYSMGCCLAVQIGASTKAEDQPFAYAAVAETLLALFKPKGKGPNDYWWDHPYEPWGDPAEERAIALILLSIWVKEEEPFIETMIQDFEERYL